MRLHDLLKQRLQLAKNFTKEFQDMVKDDLKYYNADEPNPIDELNVDLVAHFSRRYQFTIPLVYTNHESMMASMFDRVPELIFTSRGKEDEDKKQKVIAAYEYLKDKCDLEMFMNDAAWWYLLSGLVSSHIGYSQKTVERPALLEDGTPELDQDGNQMTYVDYLEDDPTIEVDDPFKVYFSPESQFSIDAKKVPYKITEQLMTPELIKKLYNKEVQADTTINAGEGTNDKVSEEAGKDLERVKTYRYYGTLPKMVKGEVKNWTDDTVYLIVFTEKQVLFKEQTDLNEKQCRLAKWHGAPNKFFGFGIGKLLRPFQKEKSIRRGQMIRYADVAAFPKLLLDETTKIDKKTARDPRENLILTYSEKKPEYLSPPNLANVVSDANSLADQDAQQAAGLLDISQGGQNSSTVDTATGQTIFADAAEKRIRLAKKKFMQFYKQNVIVMLKMCQRNWSSEKLVNITDDRGENVSLTITVEDLQDVDFDMDIDIDTESVSINKDVLRQQAIELYNMVKDDPVVERREVFIDMVQQGFGKHNPERFIKNVDVQPGSVLVDQETGQQYTVDEAGSLVDAQAVQEMRDPTGGTDVPSTQAGVMQGAV